MKHSTLLAAGVGLFALLALPLIASAQANITTTLSATPTSGPTPLDVTFAGMLDNPSSIGGVELQYGDGSSTTLCSTSFCSGEFSVTYSYHSAGTYIAALVSVGSSSDTILNTETITPGATTTVSTSTPSIVSITPSFGPVGTTVTLGGSGFGSTNTILFGGGPAGESLIPQTPIFNCPFQAAGDTSSCAPYSQTLTFTVPSSISPYCPPGIAVACPTVVRLVTSGSSYDVSVVNNDDGFSSNASTFTVNASSTGSFTAMPTSGPVPLTVDFSGPGNTSISFGDGLQGTFLPCGGGTNCSSISHTYTAPGTYTATSDGSSVTIAVMATSTSSIAAQVSALLAQIQALEAEIVQLGGATSSPSVPSQPSRPSCVDLSFNLSRGMNDAQSGGQVSLLQAFLGIASTTGFFGSQTQLALQNWQAVHGIVATGTPQTTGWGFAGPKTRSAMGCAGSTPQPVTSTNEVTLTATPESGTAPLSVAFSTDATGTLSLTFGDGSSSAMTPGSTLTHVYENAGTYLATLFEGVNGTFCPGVSYNPNDPVSFLHLGSGCTTGTSDESAASTTVTVSSSAATTTSQPVTYTISVPNVDTAGNEIGNGEIYLNGAAYTSPDAGQTYTFQNLTPNTSYTCQLDMYYWNGSAFAGGPEIANCSFTTSSTDSTDSTSISLSPTSSSDSPGSSAGTTSLYQCPNMTGGATYSGRSVSECPSTCTGQLQTSPTCTVSGTSETPYQTCPTPTTQSCTLLGNLSQ